MGLSKHYLDTNDSEIRFSVPALAEAIRRSDSRIVFAYLLGSARAGMVKPHSDVDIAVFLDGATNLELYRAVEAAVEAILGEVRCDPGILNGAEPMCELALQVSVEIMIDIAERIIAIEREGPTASAA